MLMVILGAGASYDSISSLDPKEKPHVGVRPPLAKDLFDNNTNFRKILQRYPECHPIITYLEQAPSGDPIELTLGRLDTESNNDPERKKQLLAIRYYIRDLIRECNSKWPEQAGGVLNHKTLFDQIRPFQPAVIVTFNYDTLMERAFKTPPKITKDYLDSAGISILKMHGSTNWVQVVDGIPHYSDKPELSGADLIASAARLEFKEVIHESEVKSHNGPGHVTPHHVPAVALPIAEKREFVCPQEHLSFLNQALPKVTKIVIIGWRGAEANFTDLLKDRLGSVKAIAACGGLDEAGKTLNRLKDAGIRGDFESTTFGFTELVRSRQIEKFLAS